MDNQNQPPQSIPSNPIMPANKNSGSYVKRNWMKWLLIYFVIAILIYGGAYLVLSRKSSKPYSINYPTPTIIIQPTTTSDKTSTWQTYRNEEFGFEVKYPKDWFNITDNETNRPRPRKLYAFSNKDNKYGLANIDGMVFQVVRDITKSQIDLFEKLEKIESGEKAYDNQVIKIADLVVSGFRAVKYTEIDIAPPLGPSYPYGEKVLMKKGEATFSFVLVGSNENILSRNRDIFDQILSTFRFIK